MNAQRVLIADADQVRGEFLTQQCRLLGLDVEQAHDGVDTLQRLVVATPDLVILDVNISRGQGISVREIAAGGVFLRTTPLIVLTNGEDDNAIGTGDTLQVYYVANGSDVWERLKPLVIELLSIVRWPAVSPKDTGEMGLQGLDGCSSRSSSWLPVAVSTNGGIANNGEDGNDDKSDARQDSPSKSDESHHDSVGAIAPRRGGKTEPLETAADDRPEQQIPRPWVLCVDDDVEFANLLRLRLNQYGVDVLQAFAGMAGYRFAFTHEARAIILDQEMPDGNGEYVLRRLKENPVTQDIPVIVLTGRKDQSLARRLSNSGAARMLTKPPDWDELWAELRPHLAMDPALVSAARQNSNEG